MTDANDNPLVLLPPREPAAPMTQNNRAHDEDTKPKLNKRRRYINVTPLLQNQHQQAAPATSSDSTQRVNNTVAKELQQLQKQFSAELDSYNLHQELCWEAVKELDPQQNEPEPKTEPEPVPVPVPAPDLEGEEAAAAAVAAGCLGHDAAYSVASHALFFHVRDSGYSSFC
ncbi:hypothetical protein CSUB01_09121 [Colletotrichum sublineola]|uniref:Uncharacterized protein n=1 Tax=Colletotrichum sublineola TaxID=1173701 RepID=A0A066XWA5_COLSU|nr:hypothetical protein CSUB01_09121 [Colletotrichum sublineola]